MEKEKARGIFSSIPLHRQGGSPSLCGVSIQLAWVMFICPQIRAAEINMFFQLLTMTTDKFDFMITLGYTGHNSGSYRRTRNPAAIRDRRYWLSKILFLSIQMQSGVAIQAFFQIHRTSYLSFYTVGLRYSNCSIPRFAELSIIWDYRISFCRHSIVGTYFRLMFFGDFLSRREEQYNLWVYLLYLIPKICNILRVSSSVSQAKS